jgi:hypothetical protein
MKILDHTDKDFGRAFKRISHAFRTHFPNVEWVTTNPDIEIVQVVGKVEYDYLCSKDSLKNVVMHQQCLFTTGISVEDWSKLWKECKLVISFHPIYTYTDEKINFLRTPLGAELDTFPISKVQRIYDVFTTGHVAEPECLDKVFDACITTNKKMFHTGENFKWNSNYYQFLEYMNDPWYVSILQKVKYVTGLRKQEGFEMACIEGAMTGAVPIVPDIQTYIDYRDFCIYISMSGDITKQLVNIFNSEYKPLSLEQINYVRDRFSWKRICGDIYKRLLDD